MRKSELITMLSNPDLPDIDVFLARDAEGNGFNAVDEISWEQEDDDSYIVEELGGEALIIWPI